MLPALRQYCRLPSLTRGSASLFCRNRVSLQVTGPLDARSVHNQLLKTHLRAATIGESALATPSRDIIESHVGTISSGPIVSTARAEKL